MTAVSPFRVEDLGGYVMAAAHAAYQSREKVHVPGFLLGCRIVLIPPPRPVDPFAYLHQIG